MPQLDFIRPFIAASAGICLVAAVAVGCASSAPDIPEDSENSQAQYQSTQNNDGSESGSSSSQGTADQEQSQSDDSANGEPAQGNRRLTTGPGGAQGRQGPGGTANSGNATVPKATGPVAHVNGEPIPAKKFNDQINKLSKSQQLPPRRLRAAAPQLIDKLIDQRLVDDYIEQHDVSISDERVDNKLDEVRKEFKQANTSSAGKIKTLEDARNQMGISNEELRESIRQSLAIEEILTAERGVKLPTEKDARSFYDNNSRRFQQPERVRASHIVIRVADDKQESDKAWKKAKKRAKKVADKAQKDDADFAKLAKKHSEGPTADKGGDLGFFTKKGMRGLDGLANAAFDMSNGEVSDPVKSQFGWHVIKRTGHKEAGTVPFEDVKGQIQKQLKNRKLKKELQSLVDDLRDQAKIEKHPDNVS